MKGSCGWRGGVWERQKEGIVMEEWHKETGLSVLILVVHKTSPKCKHEYKWNLGEMSEFY